MRRYETICIADPDANEENRAGLFEKIRNLIAKEKGIIVDFDEWGNRQLAYEIRKKTRGYYVCITYGGTGELVSELERNFRLDDRVLKYMTILLEKDIDPEALRQEKEADEAAKGKNVSPAESAAPTQEENSNKDDIAESAKDDEASSDNTDNTDAQPENENNAEGSQPTEEEK